MGARICADPSQENEEGSFTNENLGIACRKQIDELHKEKQITGGQHQNLYELVWTLDQMHLVNVLGILHNNEEMKRLARHAGRITGWDAERGIFFSISRIGFQMEASRPKARRE